MYNVKLGKSATYLVDLLQDREISNGHTSVSKSADTVALSSDPRSARTISPAIADVLLSFSDKTSTSDPSEKTVQSRSHRPIIDDVDGNDLTNLELDLHTNRFKSRAPSSLAEKLQKYTDEELSEGVDVRLSDKSLVEMAKDNVLGIIHYHYDDKEAQQWMEEHFGPSGEMNCDPNDPCVQAVLNGTAKIFRGTDIPEVGLWNLEEKIYGTDPVSKSRVVVGTRTSSGIDKNFVAEFEKNNPGYGVRPVLMWQDVALVVYAKP
ncbi:MULTISPECIES: hypothetical protein [unclassified Methylobacterium]|jgi:hypothetical protein|uniref:hypothetical protein n=1 Tax=unclassified Methylobacterium TaxID=2615210 RepID=UPI001352319F|nr:hypothetical protein [Methylobacterium sp. 2A]MWV22756.1 hypothetical protein [Methylobacterium sp. 2A]